MSKVEEYYDGYWIWLSGQDKPDYEITGKYLFFDSNKKRLIDIAHKEISEQGFHKAKVNDSLLGGRTEHVLCLYYKDDSRKNELAQRNNEQYGVKYRYWKSDAATLQGEYSKEFLENISEDDRQCFGRKRELN